MRHYLLPSVLHLGMVSYTQAIKNDRKRAAMNCTNHPDIIVKTSCDVCHKPYCPNCLQDDRGRFVCKQCFDPSNQPGELPGPSSDPPVSPDDETISRSEARRGFWQSKTGLAILWVFTCLLIVASIVNVYYDVVHPRHDEQFMRVVELIMDMTNLPLWLVAFYILRHPTAFNEFNEQPKPAPLSLPTLILALSPGILLVIYFWWLVFRI